MTVYINGVDQNAGGGPVIKTYTWVVAVPSTGGVPGPRIPANATVNSVHAYVTAATSAAFNIEERATVGVAGTDIMTGDMTATVAETVDTTPALTSLTAGRYLWLDVGPVVGTPGQLCVTLTVTEG